MKEDSLRILECNWTTIMAASSSRLGTLICFLGLFFTFFDKETSFWCRLFSASRTYAAAAFATIEASTKSWTSVQHLE